MNSWDSTLFLWLNLGPDAAPWLVAAARWASGQLPPAMVTAALALALAGRPDWRATAARALAAMALAFGVSALWLPARWPVRAGLLTAALAVAWSRVALGLHFPSDVLVGALLGALCALAARRLRARPVPRGAAAPAQVS